MESVDCPKSVVTASQTAVQGLPDRLLLVDIAEVRTEQGKLHLFVAIDRTSKFAFAQLYEADTVRTSAAFLEALIAAVPYKIHTVLTDNGVQFWICRNIDWGRQRDTGCIASSAFAGNMVSNIVSPSQITHGPTARSNA